MRNKTTEIPNFDFGKSFQIISSEQPQDIS